MLRLKKDEYELLESAIRILKEADVLSKEYVNLIADSKSENAKSIWAIIMDSGDVLEYETMVPELSRKSCSNNCATACTVTCITGCNASCKGSCKGSCNTKCGNAYRVAAGQ